MSVRSAMGIRVLTTASHNCNYTFFDHWSCGECGWTRTTKRIDPAIRPELELAERAYHRDCPARAAREVLAE